MKQKFLTLLCAAGLLLGSTAASAQPNPTHNDRKNPGREMNADHKMHPEAKVQRATERMTSYLELTPQQQQEVQKLFLSECQQLQKQCGEMKRDGMQGSRDHAACKAQCKERIAAQLKTILTPTQYAKWEQHCKSSEKRGHFKRGEMRPADAQSFLRMQRGTSSQHGRK